MGFIQFLQGIGRGINSGFNSVKNFARGVSGSIKGIASAVGTGARFFQAIPGIGAVASTVANVADAVGTGVDIGNRVLDFGEGIQNQLGLDTGRPTTSFRSGPAPRQLMRPRIRVR